MDSRDPRGTGRAIAERWFVRAVFVDADPLLFDLGTGERVARELFAETRRQYEKAKNNSAVFKHVDLGDRRYEVRGILDLQIVAPGDDLGGDVVPFEHNW